MPSLRSQALIALLQLIRRRRIYASAEALEQSIAEVRRTGPALPTRRQHSRLDISVQDRSGHPIFTIRPKVGRQRTAINTDRQVMYLHGGAYVRPITPFHWQLVEHIVSTTGYTVTVPLYPLAPETSCAQTVPFVVDLIEELQQASTNTPLTLIGDSAGGGLAMACSWALRDRQLRVPDQLLLITPWLNVDSQHPELTRLAARDPMLAIDGSRHAGRLYAGELSMQHPWVSPALGDALSLPPTTIWIGTRDLAHLDARDWALQAQAQGAHIDLRIGQDMIHVWPLLPFPEGRQTRQEICQALTGCAVHSATSR